MANLLRICEDFAVPYLDDIAIFSLAWDDHLKHLKDVFDHLRFAKLHIKPSKCQFAQAYVKYLGHLVGQGLRTPGELKVQVIKDFPIPTNKTQFSKLCIEDPKKLYKVNRRSTTGRKLRHEIELQKNTPFELLTSDKMKNQEDMKKSEIHQEEMNDLMNEQEYIREEAKIATDIQAMRSSSELTDVLYTKKTHLRKPCDVEQACFGTTTG
ncbi:reverse transcriptase domain-containing protein [Trichonephila clavipes]|uniref:Reverse transcriptase domain-containing protein n=1 Tax=Trichonephila clavipes TaxID=2585209 RepID=A0A8X6WIH0_TRICX|nr:reverse transcriptase domain-containing protein [Trichonephila clavipes]